MEITGTVQCDSRVPYVLGGVNRLYQPAGCLDGNVKIYFEAGANVDETTGGLINSGGTSNVEVKLYNASQASVVGTQITPGKSTVQPAALTSTGGTQWFYAGYSTDANGAASAGTVSTSVTYSLIYY